MALLAANVIVCETVLFEKTDIPSAIRIMDTLALASENNFAHFFVVTRLASQPGDFLEHLLKVQVTHQNGLLIAEAADYRFQYGYKIDAFVPGGFILTTEFNIDTRAVAMPSGCLVTAFLDGQSVARTPLMLRRG